MSRPLKYLLDTNILLETRKKHPDPGVVRFLSDVDSANLFVSSLTLGELRKGVEMKRKSDPVMADQISEWLDGIEKTFSDKVLTVDSAVAKRWGILASDRSRPFVDTLIAATALVHGLSLVTRNTSDLDGISVLIVNPWDSGA